MADLRPVYVAGDGDVKGPASSSNNFLPLFAGTTGKLLKSSGTGVTAQGLAILDDNTPAEQRNTIGLSQVNNTSDINKPISTSQQNALNLKADKINLSQVNNTSDINKPVSAAQQTALNLKQDKLQYTPVQQGGGIGQNTHKVYIGWSNANRLKVTVDATDLGSVIFDSNTATESAVGVAKIATSALALAGTDNATIMTPAKTKAMIVQAAPRAATESVAGIAKIATQALTNEGVDDTTVVTPKKLRFGISMSLGVNGYVALPSWLGGVIFQWGNWSIAGGAAATSIPMNIGFPNTAFYLAPQWQQSAQIQAAVTFMGSFNGGRTAYNMWTNQPYGSFGILWFAVGN